MRRQKAWQAAQVGIDEVFHAAFADAGQIGHCRRQDVRRQGDGLGVEVAAGQDLLGVGENQGIVGGAVHLTFDDLGRMGDGAAQGAVDLGHAAHAVGVLHLGAVGVRGHDLAVGQQPAQVGRAGNLARMRPHLLNAFIKWPQRAFRRFNRHCPRNVGDSGQMSDANQGLGQ